MNNIILIKKLSLTSLIIAAFLALWMIISPQYSDTKQLPPIKSFNLKDTNGLNFTEKSLHGHWTILFFGYMSCPDICPRTLNVMKDVWQQYGQRPPARFLFANLTPVDDHETLKLFLKNYNTSFTGISGTPEELEKLTSQLGIYSEKSGNLIDHTASLMLINPRGRLAKVIVPPFNVHDVVNEIDKAIM